VTVAMKFVTVHTTFNTRITDNNAFKFPISSSVAWFRPKYFYHISKSICLNKSSIISKINVPVRSASGCCYFTDGHHT
jgi:hypothetical protein